MICARSDTFFSGLLVYKMGLEKFMEIFEFLKVSN